jgi:hypothetical protein
VDTHCQPSCSTVIPSHHPPVPPESLPQSVSSPAAGRELRRAQPAARARRTAETLAGPNAGASRIDFNFQVADSEAGPGVHVCHPP